MIDEERLKQLKDSLAKELLGLGWKVKASINICIMKNFLSHTCACTHATPTPTDGVKCLSFKQFKIHTSGRFIAHLKGSSGSSQGN